MAYWFPRIKPVPIISLEGCGSIGTRTDLTYWFPRIKPLPKINCQIAFEGCWSIGVQTDWDLEEQDGIFGRQVADSPAKQRNWRKTGSHFGYHEDYSGESLMIQGSGLG